MLPFQVWHNLKKTAVIADDGTQFTYRDLNDFTESVREIIPHRCLLFLLCQNSPGSLLGYVSFISGEIVPLMLDSKIDNKLLSGLIKIYKPQYLWVPDHRVVEFLPGKPVFSKFKYTLVKLDSCNHYPLHKDLALLLTTSGSTGSSKFVRISYENLTVNAASIAEYLLINENERPGTTLPMSYAYGLSVINSHLLKGATILLTSATLMEREFWTFIKNRKATSLAGVPYSYKMLKKLQFSQMELPSITTLTQAGGKLSPELSIEISRYCLQSGKRFFMMYGQTEATARMSYLPPEYSLTKPESIGIAIPGGEFRLVDDQGSDIEADDHPGELVYKGKNVCMGYANHGDDLVKRDENRGVLFTGDVAKRDCDGFYYLIGRKSRFIKIYGNRLNLDEAERLLENIIPECACTGTDDHLVVHITDKTRINEIQKYFSARTGLNPAAISCRHCAEIPRNPAGKTIYAELDNS
ncbi:MAG: AMP-binding protein [Bacteroidales bacterium]